MDIEGQYKHIDSLELAPLLSLVETEIVPCFLGEGAGIWDEVTERSRWIGKEDRPDDIGFRKMRPTSYLQLCILNDETPFSPWARPLPSKVINSAGIKALMDTCAELCERHYGPGVLYFLVLAVLGPQGKVPRHRDMPHDINKKAHSHHLHISITQGHKTEFMIDDKPFFMEPGGVYEINNMSYHSVQNLGDGYRVNLMLDYCPEGNVELRNTKSEQASGIPA